MSGHRISEVARRTGFSATTLRYYDDIGLVTASDRSEAGYRLYDDRALDRLAFIARGKQFGLNLEEVRELVGLWDGAECAPVQQRMAGLVDSKIADTQERISQLVAFGHELQLIAARLRSEPHPGPCDDTCVCLAETSQASTAEPIALTVGPNDPDRPAIVCTLSGTDAIAGRVDEWQGLLATATGREAIDGGVRLQFPAGAATAAELARLAAAEQECCSFFDFTVRLASGGTALEVRAPADARDVVASLFGMGSRA
jgi:MerR family copper efflux transcriptional regulator